MRQEVTSHIRKAASALNTNGCADDGEHDTGDIGSFATKVAAVARMCKIPDTEVLYEAVGQATGTYRRRSSCVPDIEVCTAYGPTYMKQKQHRHWYHVGQNHHHTAALLQSKSPMQQQFANARRQLQQELLLKAHQGTLAPARAADELLQSCGSNAHSDKASSRSSNSGGLPALPLLQPMTSSASSSADAPLSGSSSSSEEELQPGFQTDFDSSDSATCTPTYAGDEACLGMLLGTSFRRRQ